MDSADKCPKCGAAYPKGAAQVCSRCGWDGQVGMRKCTTCQGAIVLNERLGYGPAGGMAGITGLIFWHFFGLLLGGAVASFIAALCGLVTTLTLKYSCAGCDRGVESRILDAGEKDAFKKTRLRFLFGSVGFGVLSVVLLGAAALLFNHRMSAGS